MASKNDGKLRGFAALTAMFNKPSGRGGGRAASGNGPVNISAALTEVAGKPLSGPELCAHALGLGLWKTGAANPVASFVHPLSSDVLKDDGSAKLEKPEPGFYNAIPGVQILPIQQTNFDPVAGHVMPEAETFDENGNPVDRPIFDFLEQVYLPLLADGTFTKIDVLLLPIA